MNFGFYGKYTGNLIKLSLYAFFAYRINVLRLPLRQFKIFFFPQKTVLMSSKAFFFNHIKKVLDSKNFKFLIQMKKQEKKKSKTYSRDPYRWRQVPLDGSYRWRIVRHIGKYQSFFVVILAEYFVFTEVESVSNAKPETKR